MTKARSELNQKEAMCERKLELPQPIPQTTKARSELNRNELLHVVLSWRRPTLPPHGSTIGAAGLDFSVRKEKMDFSRAVMGIAFQNAAMFERKLELP